MKKKVLAAILTAGMIFSLTACAGKSDVSNSAPATETEVSAETEAPAEPVAENLTYKYDQEMGDFVITWTIHLNGDGSCSVEELHGLSGETLSYTTAGWTDNGDGTVTTGAWNNQEADKSEFFNQDGSCTWILNDDGSCTPAGGLEEGGESAGASLAGQYSYDQEMGDFVITWTVHLNGDGSCFIEELHGLSGETLSYTTAGWTDNGDGTVTTGAWNDQEANKSEFFAADGSCTWTVNEDGTVTPVE